MLTLNKIQKRVLKKITSKKLKKKLIKKLKEENKLSNFYLAISNMEQALSSFTYKMEKVG